MECHQILPETVVAMRTELSRFDLRPALITSCHNSGCRLSIAIAAWSAKVVSSSICFGGAFRWINWRKFLWA
jgi:hypothetical protein